VVVPNPGSNNVTVLLGAGDGSFTAASASPFTVGSGPDSVAVEDFNGDGNADVAVANAGNNNVTVLLGDGGGGFTASASPFAVGTHPVSMAVADFNQDGIADLAVANYGNNNVTVLLGDGSGGFAAASGSPFAVGNNPISAAVGDFNGDGIADVAVANSGSNNVTVLLGNGSGGFTAATASPFAVGGGPYSVAVADFNGDGNPDLAVTNSSGNNATVLVGDGSGGFATSIGSPFAAGASPHSAAVGDFNGDGSADLAVANFGGNNMTVLVGDGSGGFAAASGSPFLVGSLPLAVAVADFNGDGKADLAVANSNSNNVTILLGIGFAAQLKVTQHPASGMTGAPIGSVAVQIEDASGNLVSGSTAAVTIASAPDGVGGTLTVNAVGGTATFSNLVFNAVSSYTLTASATGLTSATSASIQITPASQAIIFAALSNVTLAAPPLTVSATASSSLPVSFASTTTAVCTVSGSTVTLVALGTCTIQASQAGSANYLAAPSVNQSFQVTLGSLQGSGTSMNAAVNLTTEGTVDWVHWGDSSLNRKVGVTAQLSAYTKVGNGTVSTYNNDPRALSWTDGTAVGSSSNNRNGFYINGVGNGFSFTAPADTTLRSLVVHVGGYNSGGNLTAHLSDGSATDYTDVTIVSGVQYDRNYTLSYQAGSAGQTLTVTWKMTSGAGNVTLNAGALQGGGNATGTIAATAGTPQSTTVNLAFTTPLQVTVSSGGNPVNGATVTFSAPTAGASGAFNTGPIATATTNASGVATAPTLTANSQAGGYNVHASVTGVTTPASFSLSNNAGPAASIVASAGGSQSANLSTAFATALQATVKDSFGNPVNTTTVTFSAPTTGASGTFSTGTSATATTNASGVATAPTLTANGQTGGYTVTATIAEVATPANFSLTNTAAPIGGSLQGTGTSATTTVNLTTEGSADWVHWGEASVSRKAGVTAQLSTYTKVGSGTVTTYNNDLRALAWTDGTAAASSSNNRNGFYISGVSQGFSLTAPADATLRTVVVHVGGYKSGGTLTAHLSDGSAADYIDVTAVAGGQYDRNYTLNYQAASAGQILTVTWKMTSGTGNVTLSGAALH
jgi:FG-GAP-like repeat